MEENIFPHSRSQLDGDEMEEERRLAYVGITRAKERLYLVHAQSRVLYGNMQANLPSRFLADIPEHLVVADASYGSGSPAAAILDRRESGVDDINQEPSFLEPGDAVNHPKFGQGKVKEISDSVLTVEFVKGGVKKLSSAFASLLRKD